MRMRESFLVLSLLPALPALAGERPQTRSYTDADLARVRPLRGETGVLSEPAFRPAASRPAEIRGEAYWRREADRVRDQIRPLRAEADALRVKIAMAARTPPRPPSSGKSRRGPAPERPAPDTRLLEQRLGALEQEIRERQDRLEDRARKEGALPGWLR